MGAKQRIVPLGEFAKAMLEADTAFSGRVRRFEERFGSADEDTRAVLAQAGYLCWVNAAYQDNLLELCRAVRTGRPTSLLLHCQVSPGRRVEMNAYVVGVQRWLGIDLPPPDGIDGTRVGLIAEWLGEPTPAKVALAELFLFKLVDDLLNYVSLAKLGGNVEPDEADYADFSCWYARPDGSAYSTTHALAPGDGNRWTWDNEAMAAFVEERKQRVRDAMRSAPEDIEELIRKILTLTQPPCMHRFSRYMDIQLASIGALRWRGSVPPDDVPKADWRAFLDEARAALQTWIDDAPPDGELARKLHEALGKATERGKAVIRDFLLPDTSENMGVSWDWLVPKAKEKGTTAATLFGRTP